MKISFQNSLFNAGKPINTQENFEVCFVSEMLTASKDGANASARTLIVDCSSSGRNQESMSQVRVVMRQRALLPAASQMW